MATEHGTRRRFRPLARYFADSHQFGVNKLRAVSWSGVRAGRRRSNSHRATVAYCVANDATLQVADLHGMRAREARRVLRPAAADVVAVCHGKGTGVLREVTHEEMHDRYLFVSTATRGQGRGGVSTFVARRFVSRASSSRKPRLMLGLLVLALVIVLLALRAAGVDLP